MLMSILDKKNGKSIGSADCGGTCFHDRRSFLPYRFFAVFHDGFRIAVWKKKTPPLNGIQSVFRQCVSVSPDPFVLPFRRNIVAEKCDLLMFQFQLMSCRNISRCRFISADRAETGRHGICIQQDNGRIQFFQLGKIFFPVDLCSGQEDKSKR